MMNELQTQIPKVIIYERVAWMQKVTDKRTHISYYTLGVMTNMDLTLAVTPVGGNGNTLLYCRTHQIAYTDKEKCVECQNAVLDEGLDLNSELSE